MNETFYNFKIETSCRVSLNLENLSQLEISNLQKLIINQGKKLNLPEWEINALLSIGSRDRISLEHVLKIIYDYAGLQDCISRDFTDFMIIHRDISMKLMQNDLKYISSCFARQSIKLMSLFTSLCNWRRLQSYPRPYFVYNDNNMNKRSVQSILKCCAKDLFQLVNSLDIDLRYHQVLLHDACISTAAHLDTTNMFIFLDIDNHISNDNFKDESLKTTTNQLVDTINRIIAMENATENVYKTYASVLEEADPYESFPIMRLPYGDKAPSPPMDDLAWFEDAIHDYKTCAEVLNYYKKSLISISNTTTNKDKGEVHIDGDSYFGHGNRGRSKSMFINKVNNDFSSSSSSSAVVGKKKSSSFDNTSTIGYSNGNGHVKSNGFSNHEAPQMFNEIARDLEEDDLDNGMNGLNGTDDFLEDIGVLDVLEAVKQQEEREEDLASGNDHKKNSNKTDDEDIWRPKPRSKSPTFGMVPRRKGSKSFTVNHNTSDKDNSKATNGKQQTKKKNDKTSSTKSSKNSTMNKKVMKQKEKEQNNIITETSNGNNDGSKEDSYRKLSSSSINSSNGSTLRAKRPSQGSTASSIVSHTVGFDSEQNYKVPNPDLVSLRTPNIRPLSGRPLSPLSGRLDSNMATPINTDERMTIINSSSATSLSNSPARITSAGTTRSRSNSIIQSNSNSRSNYNGSRRFSSKSMEVLSTFSALTSRQTRNEARLESQVVYIALRDMQVDGSTLVEAAVVKIQIWWKLTWPKYQLRKRIASKTLCHSIIDDLVSDAFYYGHKKFKRQMILLRIGAAVRIQRCFKEWKSKILSNCKLIQITWKKYQLRKKFNRILMYTRSGVRLYRFIRARNQRYHRRSRFGCKRFLQVYFQLIGSRVQKIAEKKFQGSRKASVGISSYGDSRSPMKSKIIHHLNTAAVVTIQKNVRRFLLQLRLRTAIKKMKMSIYLGKCLDILIVRHKVIRGLKYRRACKKIQSMIRGYMVRRRIFREIASTIIILAAWRRYKSSSNLRSSLRRIERPLVVRMKKITGIKAATKMANNISVKLSVWWHPLLHIVTANDFSTIMKNKHPQLVYVSEEFACISEEAYNVADNKRPRKKSSGVWSTKRPAVLKHVSSIGERLSKKFSFAQSRNPDGQNSNSNLASKEFVCDFDNLEFVIPGCHGNSVLKFEFSSDERNLGTVTIFLGNRGQLMFWKENIEAPLQIIEARRAVIMRSSNGTHRDSSSSRPGDIDSKKKDKPKFVFTLDSGLPQMNRSQWCLVSIEGKGPARKAFRKGFSIAHFFESWERMFICTEGERLFFFKSKNALAPEYSFDVNTITKVRKEFATSVVSRMRGSDDLHNIIFNTSTDDEIGLRFPDQKSREIWRAMLERFVVPTIKRDRGIVLPHLGQLSRQFSSKLQMLGSG